MNPQTILLVEDDPNDVLLTMCALRKSTSSMKLSADDGAQALDYLSCTNRYSQRDPQALPAVVLDVKLTQMSGVEVLRRVRQDPRTERLPVIVLTSSDNEQDLIDCRREGANGYVQKPVNLARFTEAVRQLGCYWLMVNEPLPRM